MCILSMSSFVDNLYTICVYRRNGLKKNDCWLQASLAISMYDELAWTLDWIGIMSVLSPKDVSPSRVELLAF